MPVVSWKEAYTLSRVICRFFAGFFGSCPLAVVAAVFADMYNNRVRGFAVALFSATVIMGELLECILLFGRMLTFLQAL